MQGKQVKRFNGEAITLNLVGEPVRPFGMTLKQHILAYLMDPNVAFILLAVGALALYAEFNHPGAVVPGTVGVVFILIAWYGAAHAKVEQQQIPYMVSGAFAGLGCMVVGGLLYWGHWLYRIYDQAELHHEEQQRMMLELVRAIHATGPGATSGAVGVSSYMATSTGTVYHQADCPVIAHHPNDLRVLGASELGGLRPCQICSPDGP